MTSVDAQDSHARHKKSVSVVRPQYFVILDGQNVTPDKISDDEFLTLDYKADTALATHRERSEQTRKSILGIHVDKEKDAGVKVFATTINLDDIQIDHSLNTEEGIELDVDLGQAPSAFYLPKEYPRTSYPPEMAITLKETPTKILFELPSISYDKGTSRAYEVEQENEAYLYLTVGKGRNRKTVNMETQTKGVVTQTRHALATRPEKKNAISFASVWDMLDTYAKLAQATKAEEKNEMVLFQEVDAKYLRKKKKKDEVANEVDAFSTVGKLPSFLDKIIMTERCLAATQYSDQQKKLRGLVPYNPLALDLVFVYTMTKLWTFQCEETDGRSISSLQFSAKNPNILAVSYGKFRYTDQIDGLICLWCTKNPCKPERIYRFDSPSTCLAFSHNNPHWLACGFNNGNVIILDVTSHFKKIIAFSTRNTNPSFEPIWTVNWTFGDYNLEYVITTGQDGRVNHFHKSITNEFVCGLMMRVTSVDGKMPGVESIDPCVDIDVPITRYPAALCFDWHPRLDGLYFVGTDEGYMHNCSVNYKSQCVNVFKAHKGPVYSIRQSPFIKTILVTCGADNSVRIWMEAIEDCVITLNCKGPVLDVALSPVNSTLLISVSSNYLSIWDIRRKTHIPCAEYTFANNVILTNVRFSPKGENVFVSDTNGQVHTFQLKDTPIPPYYQKKLLLDAIRNALYTKPHLMKTMDKVDTK